MHWSEAGRWWRRHLSSLLPFRRAWELQVSGLGSPGSNRKEMLLLCPHTPPSALGRPSSCTHYRSQPLMCSLLSASAPPRRIFSCPALKSPTSAKSSTCVNHPCSPPHRRWNGDILSPCRSKLCPPQPCFRPWNFNLSSGLTGFLASCLPEESKVWEDIRAG